MHHHMFPELVYALHFCLMTFSIFILSCPVKCIHECLHVCFTCLYFILSKLMKYNLSFKFNSLLYSWPMCTIGFWSKAFLSRCPLQPVISLFESEWIRRCMSKPSHIWGDTLATTNRSADGEMLLMSWRLSGNFPQSAEQLTHSGAEHWSLFFVKSLDRELLVNTVSVWWTPKCKSGHNWSYSLGICIHLFQGVRSQT